jgi:hypothetical protein
MVAEETMIAKALKSLSFWIAFLLLAANGVAWIYALAPEDAPFSIEPRLEPDIANLRQRLLEGGHSGEPFQLQVTDQEAAETIAWYLARHPSIPFRQPQVNIQPDGIEARGAAEIAGLRVGLMGRAAIELQHGVPYVTLEDLDVAGVAIPGFVRSRIQSEIDAQFSLSQNLPLVIDHLVLKEGEATVSGTIR